MFKRIGLFLLVNLFVVLTISFILRILNVQPYLTAYGLNYQSLMIFCLIWGMGGALISLMLSRITAKWMLGVKIVDENTNHPQMAKLYQMVERLSREAHLPSTPQIGIFESAAPNAFATGPTKRRSLVAVSTALLNSLSPGELEAVIGHEISHIANGDMVTMTLLQGVVNAFVMFLARILAFFITRSNRSEKGQGGGYYLFVFLFEIVFMILGSMVIAYYSRRREYKADYGGACLSSRNNMIKALTSLERASHQVRNNTREAAPLEAFMIQSQKRSSWAMLFSTHPPLKERIEKLESYPSIP